MFLLGWTSIALVVALCRNIFFRFNFVTAKMKDLGDDISRVIKVSWLSAIKMLVLPLLVGYSIEHAVSPLFERTLEDTSTFFYSYPTCSLLLHWVGGVTFMLFITVLMLELNDMLHPNVLRRLIRLPDPKRHMCSILLSERTTMHLRRLLVSSFVYFSCIFLLLYVFI